MQNTMNPDSQPSLQSPSPRRGRGWRIFAIVVTAHAILLGGVVLIQGCGKGEPQARNEDAANPLPSEITPAPPAETPEAPKPAAPLPGNEALMPEEKPAGPGPSEAPAPSPAPAPENPPAAPKASPAATTYSVRKGDTLSRIARKHGVSVRELADMNKISVSTPLKVGQKVKVPAAARAASAETRAPVESDPSRTHIVKSGETLIAIAKQYGVSVEALMKANNISDARKLRVNQKLQIPSPVSSRQKSSSRGRNEMRPVMMEEPLDQGPVMSWV